MTFAKVYSDPYERMKGNPPEMLCVKEEQRTPQSKIPITFEDSSSPTFLVSRIS